MMAELGVNIDHVATVRQARQTYEPDPVAAAVHAELGGADGITVHLREDRRHIQDRDVRLLRETVGVKLNLEVACVAEIIDIACQIQPDQVTLVPERREEVTTEGGLDILTHQDAVKRTVEQLHASGIPVSLFLDPEVAQIEMAAEIGAQAVELHTGPYALSSLNQRHRGEAHTGRKSDELIRLVSAARQVNKLGMVLHAGHGLNYHNVKPVAAIEAMCELNIGHSIVARAVMVGLERAVREMKLLIE